MHFQRLAAAPVVASALILLAGCSSSGSSQLPAGGAAASSRFVAIDALAPKTPPQRGNLVLRDPVALTAQVFVAAYDASGSVPVNDYNANNKKNKAAICKITAVGEGINAITVDASGNVWVPQGLDTQTGQPDVVSFAPNCGKQGSTLGGLTGQPAGIAFASDGTRYVNQIAGPSSSAGDVAVFPKGKRNPSRYLTDPNVLLAAGIGIDSHDNVYLSYYSPSSATGVMVFKGGQMPGKPIKNFQNGAPGAIAFDKNDNLIITDDAAVTLNVYAPPYTKAPKTYPIKGHSPQCSLNRAQTNLACGDKTNATVDTYSYPAGKYQYSFSKGLSGSVIGTAQDPR